jgi:hypothetical protein
MNLMFYDFNNSSAVKPTMTGQNFYSSANNSLLIPAEDPRYPARPQGVEGGGDRVPTRERGQYRSAHQNFRRRKPIVEEANQALFNDLSITN